MVVLLKGGTGGADADESKKQTFYILNSSKAFIYPIREKASITTANSASAKSPINFSRGNHEAKKIQNNF